MPPNLGNMRYTVISEQKQIPLCDNVNEFMFACWRISYPVVDKKLFFFLEPLIRPHILDLGSYHKLNIDLESGLSQRKKKKEFLEMLQHIPHQFSYPAENPPLYEHLKLIVPISQQKHWILIICNVLEVSHL